MQTCLRRVVLSFGLVTAGLASADVPKVVTDIAPVQSLVAQVMDGVGTPDTLLPSAASPHGYALRPSQARTLENADLVIWVGPLLTPWLDRARQSLASDTAHIALMDVESTRLLDYRDLAVFAVDEDHEGHDDHDKHDDHDDHDKHDDHADHEKHDDHDKHEDHADHGEHKDHDKHDDHEDHADHDKHEDHDDHADHGEHKDHDKHDDHDGHEDHEETAADGEHDHDHDHDHSGGADPHVWLDPQNAAVWVTAIAEQLSVQDPDNEATYKANAAKALVELGSLEQEMTARLEAVKGSSFLVYHDAYQYLEARFELPVVGAIAASDAQSPSAARLAELRDAVQDQGVSCIFAEPQYSTKLVTALADGTSIKQTELDPLGGSLTQGPDFYSEMMLALSDQITTCLK